MNERINPGIRFTDVQVSNVLMLTFLDKFFFAFISIKEATAFIKESNNVAKIRKLQIEKLQAKSRSAGAQNLWIFERIHCNYLKHLMIKGEKKKYPMCCFDPQMVAMVRTGAGSRQEPEAIFGSSMWRAGTQAPWYLPRDSTRKLDKKQNSWDV